MNYPDKNAVCGALPTDPTWKRILSSLLMYALVDVFTFSNMMPVQGECPSDETKARSNTVAA
jgi:hypothetical protein